MLKDEWDARMNSSWPQGCRLVEGGTQKQCLPRLLILGQFKAGSTALFDTLAQACPTEKASQTFAS